MRTSFVHRSVEQVSVHLKKINGATICPSPMKKIMLRPELTRVKTSHDIFQSLGLYNICIFSFKEPHGGQQIKIYIREQQALALA